MNLLLRISYLALVLLLCSPSNAASLLLRERATQHGTLVRLGDIADISAATTAEVDTLSSIALLPAPAPGTQQFLTVAKIRDLLSAQGVELSELSIKGSLFVEIGEAQQSVEPQAEPTAKPMSKSEAELLVCQAIEKHLASTNTEARWRVEVSLTSTQLKQLETLGSDFSAQPTQTTRSGRMRFDLQSRSQSVLKVTADLTQFQTVVVAKQAIARGQLVRAVDVELSEREGNLPSGTLTNLEAVVGKVALRSFKPEDLVQQRALRAAWQVRKGETVDALVRAGSVVVRTRAIAKQNGAMGELVTVETLDDKQRLDVTVSGPGEVTIYATGGRVSDYATLNPDKTRLR